MAENTPIVPIDLSTGPAPQAQDFGNIDIPQTPDLTSQLAPSSFQPQQQVAAQQSYLDMDLSEVMSKMQTESAGKTFDNPIVTPEPMTRKYPIYNPFLNNEQIYAENQSWLSKWGNGLAKMGGLAIGSFANGLMSIPDTIRGLSGGNVYQNEWSQSIDNWTQNLENVFPNYYTQWEIDHPFMSAIPFSGGAANFWADKFSKNLGYTIGAISSAVVQDLAIGAVTEGIGELPLIANQVGKASLWLNKIFTGANRLDDVLATANALNKSERTIMNITSLARAAEAQKIGKGVQYLTTLYTASHAEAGMEARQGYNEVKEELTNDFFKKNGYMPNEQEASKIEEYATAAGNTRYGLNMAILTLSNAVQFEHILKPWNSYKQGLKTGIEGATAEQAGRIGLANKAVNAAEDIDKLAVLGNDIGRVGSIWNKIKPVIPNILSEGVLEEGGQYAAGEGVKDYFKNKFNGTTRKDMDAVLASTIHGLGEQFGTTEGWENMFIGGLTGAILAPITKRIENHQRKNAGVLTPEAATAHALDNLNQQGVTGLFENNYKNAAQTMKNAADIEKAVRSGNIFAFKNLQADSFFNFITSGIQNNRFEVRLEQLRMLKELPNEELNKLFAIEDGTRESNHAYIDGLITKAEGLRKSHEAISKVFSNPYTYRGNAQNEAQIAETDKWKAFEDYKSALIKFSYTTADFNGRLTSIEQDLKRVNPMLSNALASQLSSKKGLEELAIDYKEEAIALQKQIETGLLSGEARAQVRERIKALNTHAEHISDFFRGDYEHMALAPELADFEMNGRVHDGNITMDKAFASDLITYGHDINQIKYGKQYASAAYDHLLTREGFEDFMTNYDEWVNSLSMKQNYEPEVEDVEDTIEVDKDTKVETGRTYKQDKDYAYTVAQGTNRVKSPFGDIVSTHETKEDAEAARDELNANLKDKLHTMTILGEENGLVKVEDVDGKVQLIDPRFLSKTSKVLTEEEIVNARKEFNERLAAQQSEEGTSAPDYANADENIDAQDVEREEPKKLLSYLFNSTTYNANDSKDYTKRTQTFFSNVDRFPAEVRPRLRTIIVTAANEAHVGLTGLTDYLVAGTDIKKDNAQETPIVTVFTVQELDDLFFVDANGNKLGKVGEPIDFNTVIFATLPTADLSYRSRPNEKRYPNTEDDKLALQYKDAWSKKREELVKVTDNYPVYRFYVTRGVPYRTPKDADGNYQLNPVADTIVNRKDLKYNGLVVVSTGTVTHNGRNLKFPAGATLLQYGNTLEWLSNRTLTENEVDVHYDILKRFVGIAEEAGELDRETINYLQGALYYAEPKSGKAMGKSQMYLRPDGYFAIGSESFPFTVASFAANKDAIKAALAKVYTNTNNKLVKTNAPFRQIIGVDPETNELQFVTWRTYQHFLLSDRYDVAENEWIKRNSARSVNEIPFKTSVRKQLAGVENDSNYRYKSAVLTDSPEGGYLFETPKPEEKKAAPAPATPGVVTPIQGKYVSDGKTKNIYTTPGGVKVPFLSFWNGTTYEIGIETESEGVKTIVANVIGDQAFIDNIKAQGLEGTNKELIEQWIANKVLADIRKEDELMDAKAAEVAAAPTARPASATPVLDGKTVNTFATTDSGNLTYMASEKSGQMMVGLENTPENKATLAKLAAKEAVAQALVANNGTIEEYAMFAIGRTLATKAVETKAPVIPEVTATEEAIKAAVPTEADTELAKKAGKEAGQAVFTKQTAADVERRRKDELYQASLARHVAKTGQTVYDKLGQEFTVDSVNKDGKATKITDNLFGGNLLEDDAFIINPKTINAKYDAEIAALEEKKTPPKNSEVKKTSKEQPPRQKRGNSGMHDGNFRILRDAQDYTVANIEKEAKWFEENLSLPLHRMNNLIETTSGGYAFGMFYDNAVYIYNQAETGTVYHEAFHAVWSMYADSKERTSMMKEFRNRAGSFVDRETGETTPYAFATEHQINEALAEEFRDYVQEGKLATKPASGKNFIYRFFNSLLNFLRRLFSGDVSIEDMFKRINSGYYKTAAAQPTFNQAAQYRITGLSETDSYRVTKGMTTSVIQELFKDNRNLVEFDTSNYSVSELFAKVRKKYEDFFTTDTYDDYVPAMFEDGKINQAQYDKYQLLWNNINNNWHEVEAHTKEYLKTFGIIADLEAVDPMDEENLPVTNEKEGEETEYAGRTSDAYTVDHFRVDTAKNASASIKLLLATIAETQRTSEGLVNKLDEATLMPMVVNYSQTFNFLLNQLYDLNTFEEKRQRILSIGRENPVYARLASRLKIGEKDLTVEDHMLQAKFFNVFSKQKPLGFVHYIDGVRSMITATNLNAATSKITQMWIDALKLKTEEKDAVIIETKSGVYEFKGKRLESESTKNIEGQLAFLKRLGSTFTRDMYNKLSESEKNEFARAVQGLYNTLIRKNEEINITSGSLESAGNFNKIATLYLKANSDSESTFYGIEGEKRQMFVQQNTISNLTNDFNNARNREDMLDRMPHMSDPYRQDSVYVNEKLFDEDGDRTSLKLSIGYNQGIVRNQRGAKAKESPIGSLSQPERLIEEINQNLNKNYYILVPADSKTEWMMTMDHIIPFESMGDTGMRTKVYNIFNKYYKTERAIAWKSGKLNEKYKSLMYDIAGGYQEENLNQERFSNHVRANVNSIISYLMDNGIIYPSKGREGMYEIKEIDTTFTKDNRIPQYLNDKDLLTLFSFTELNYMINNIEIHKLYFGDVANIKDPLKRYKSFLSPRETSVYNNPEFNNKLNEDLNRAGDIALQENDYGYWEHKDYMKTVTMADVDSYENSIMNDKNINKNVKRGYEAGNAADAQSWGFLPAYREITWKSGGRFTEAQEELYQFLTAQDRIMMEEDGHYKYTDPSLKAQDEALVKKGYRGAATLPIRKPIGSGMTMEGATFLDKTSLAPLSYAMVRGRNMEAHYVKMWKQGVSYLIVESGRKIGATGKDTFYNADGTVNTNDYTAIVNVPFRYYGIQVETEGDHSKNTLGTQLSKEVSLNLRNAGVPIDYKSDIPWEELSTPQKRNASPIFRAIERNTEALKAIQSRGYNELLDKLGIVDMGTYFTSPDKSKVVKLLQNELFRREAPQNLKDAISLDENGELKVPFEAIPNYKQIKDILFSYVDKLVAKPKLNGGPKIQLSGAMFGTGNREIKSVPGKNGNRDVFVSNGLKFYEAQYDENGNRISVSRMEVMIPMWFRNKLRNHPQWKNKTDEEVLDYLNNSKEGQKILNGIGFRIPTQELNSAEAFVVKGFSPAWVGDAVVVPEAITTKSGSDFDVDKLNTYLKNVYVDAKGDIKVVPFLGYGQEAIDKFKDLIDGIGNTEELQDVLAEEVNAYDALENFSFDDNEASLIARANKMYKESLENEYFASMEDIVLLPQNFERLIRPNSADEFKSMRDKLASLSQAEFGSSSAASVIDRMYMSKTRHLFLVGKGGVGIAAVAQTNNAVNQSTNIYLNPENIANLPEDQRLFLGNGQILLPHNKAKIQGGEYVTLSGMLDSKGNYISDNTSMYIDGFVDIAKDPWISQIIQHPSLTSTFILINKFGSDLETVSMFMNQPIIREYVKTLLAKGTTWALYENNVKQIRTRKEFSNTSKLGMATIKMPNSDEMAEMIRRFYNGESLTEVQKAQQQMVLGEFLKYTVLANNLFDMQRAYSYDTDASPDPSMQYKKRALTQKARRSNVFSSVDNIFDNTHLGNISEKVALASEAIGEAYTIINGPKLRPYMNAVLDMFPSRMSKAKYDKAARSLEESFITYMVQTNSGGLNTRMRELLVETNTSVASKVRDLKDRLRNDANLKNSTLANNLFLKELIPMAKNKRAEVKNLMLAHKVFDSFTSDTYTGAMRELRDNPITKSLYGDIIRLSFLQSGISNSPISFHKFIPAEDYAAAIKPILDRVDTLDNLQEFVDLGMFFRNNWSNKDLVPNVVETFRFDNTVKTDVSNQKMDTLQIPWFLRLKQAHGIKNGDYQPYQLYMKSQAANSKYATLTIADKFAVETERGIELREEDKVLLLQRVEDEMGNPLKVGRNYIFVPINPLGDGFRAEEHYSEIRPSVISTDAVKFPVELPMAEIYNAFVNRKSLAESGNSSTFAEPAKSEPTPKPASFKELGAWKKTAKKETFYIMREDTGKTPVAGYKITFEGHPNLKVFVHGEKKSWTMSEESTGRSIGNGNSIKDAIEDAMSKVNNALTVESNVAMLTSIGVAQNEINTNNQDITEEPGTIDDCPF